MSDNAPRVVTAESLAAEERRDRFAAAAITGLALVGKPATLARKAVAVADALIAELGKG